MEHFKGKRVVITGAGRSLGAASGLPNVPLYGASSAFLTAKYGQIGFRFAPKA
jgi:hypothetical protein